MKKTLLIFSCCFCISVLDTTCSLDVDHETRSKIFQDKDYTENDNGDKNGIIPKEHLYKSSKDPRIKSTAGRALSFSAFCCIILHRRHLPLSVLHILRGKYRLF